MERYAPMKEEIEDLLQSAGVMTVNSMESVMWSAWLERDSRELWEHEGLCACGRRTRLFGQCMQCIAAEHAEEVQRRADEETAEDEAEPSERFKLEDDQNLVAKLEPLIERNPKTGRDELSGTAERWLSDHLRKRKEKVEEVKEESELAVGADLRSEWFQLQRSDSRLLPIIQRCAKKTDETGKYRIAGDGLLERLISRDGVAEECWVPVVPDGKANVVMSWKEF